MLLACCKPRHTESPRLLLSVLAAFAFCFLSTHALRAQELARLKASTLEDEEKYFYTEFSADGRVLLAASNRHVTLWDASTLAEIASFDAECYRHRSLAPAAISPDGQHVILPGKETKKGKDTLNYIEIATKRVVTRIAVPDDFYVAGLALSLDGSRLAVGNDRGKLAVFELPSGTATRAPFDTYSRDSDMNTMRFLADGRLVTGGEDDEGSAPLRIWDVATGQAVLQPRYQREPICSIDASADGSVLACVSQNENIKVYSVSGNQLSPRSTIPIRSADIVQLSRNGAILTFDRMWDFDNDRLADDVAIWDVVGGKLLTSFPQQKLRSLSLHPDGNMIATTSDNSGFVSVWSIQAALRQAEPLYQRQILNDDDGDDLTNLRFANNGENLAITFDDGDLQLLWDAVERKTAHTLPPKDSDGSWDSVSVDPSARHIVADYDMVYEWLPQQDTLKRFVALGRYEEVLCGAFSPDVSRFVLVTEKRLLVLDSNKQPLLKMGGEFHAKYCAVSSDNRLLALADSDDLSLIDIKDGIELLEDSSLGGHVAFSRDNPFLFGTSGDYEFEDAVWRMNTETGEVDQPFNCRDAHAIAVAPKLPILATALEDTTVKLWNYNTGELLTTLKGHKHPVTGVAIAPDGKTVASGDEEGFLCFWELDEEVLRLAAKAADGPTEAVEPPEPDGWPNHPTTFRTRHGVSIIVSPVRTVTREEVVQAMEEVRNEIQEGSTISK